MSEWRRRAADAFPELWADESVREASNLFFFELVALVRDAHRARDEAALDGAYDFALWCHEQGGDLQNSAVVSFYEHLFDSFDVHAGVAKRLPPQVVRDVWPLWQQRLSDEQLEAIRSALR